MPGPIGSPISRRQAFGMHLATSVVIFFALLGLLTLIWYPSPIFALEGGWKGLRIVALVDVVLGPLLTLVLFKPGKPGLKLDMTLIILFQAVALAWGVWTLHSTRPVLLVFADESFRSISAAQLSAIDPDGKLRARWVGESLTKVYVDLPEDPIDFTNLLQKTRASGSSEYLLVSHYRPLEAEWSHVIDDSLDIERYVAGHPAWQRALDHLLAKLGKATSDLVFLPYVGRYQRAILVADRRSKQLVDDLDIPYDPALARKLLPMSERLLRIKPEQGKAEAEPSTASRAPSPH